jgi:lysophospholipase L1-like esterase
MSRAILLAFFCATFCIALPASAQRWILAGDSIQTGVFANPEYGLPGGDARELTATLVTQETGVVIQNFSSPGARMTTATPAYFPGLKDQTKAIDFIDGFFGATGIIITIGVNDANSDVPLADYARDYTNFVRHAKSRGLEVICALPLNEPNEVPDFALSRRFAFQLQTYYACLSAGVPAANIFNPAAYGIAPDDANPAKRRLFAGTSATPDNVHLSSAGHALFAQSLIDFMVGRGFWSRN